jgi:hypothetical protein
MPPKKKQEEEAPPAEELLPPDYPIGCEVYWHGEDLEFEEEVLKTGSKGTLTAACDLAEFEKEDGGKGWTVETVEVQFADLAQVHKVPMKSLSLEPAPMDIVRSLTTGLALPLRGIDVERLWVAHGDVEKQSKIVEQLLGLEKAYTEPTQRQIAIDFHIFNIAHAKSIGLTSVKTAVFVAIMGRVLDMCRSPGGSRPPATANLAEMCTADACFKEFQRLILQHAVNNPPVELQLLTGSEVRLLTDFVKTTLFKHFLLYQYCVNFDVQLRTLRFNVEVERPMQPPKLDLSGLQPTKTFRAESKMHTVQMEQQEAETEDQEIERHVQERLRETEAKLQAKLEDREKAFRTRLENNPKGKAGAKK